MRADDLLERFHDVADAVRTAVASLDGDDRRARTGRRGQYLLDVRADAAALTVLHALRVRVLSEESGASGDETAPVTVVLDPVDGSTNCARGISYWATSMCALDRDGPLAALVANQASGEVVTAVRGGGSFRDGRRLRASAVREVGDAVVAVSGLPRRPLPWRQFRALGCASLTLCDLAAGGLDGVVDMGPWHAPWDYLGGLLACAEAGAVVVDGSGEPLVTADVAARRQILGAGTADLLDALRPALGP